MKKKKFKLAFVGCGNMGEALIKGLLGKGFIRSQDMIAADASRQRLAHLQKTYSVEVTTDNREAISRGDVILLAVKPQIMEGVLQEIASDIDTSKLLISIAAGVSIEYIESFFKKGVRLIRVMPNTPALVQEGASALSAGKKAKKEDMETAREIFEAVGKAVVVDEKLMDAVTGLSGSGPAYIFTILEALVDAGVKTGLPRQVSFDLALQTMLGSVKMVIETGEHPAKLKDMVTSPGGTTIAGLHVFEKEGLRGTLMNAVETATNRSRELGEALLKKKRKS